jgi:cellulose synthase/poly-beta-1,6-N-acetylglucosamine synthase-like glycosyltransferase
VTAILPIFLLAAGGAAAALSLPGFIELLLLTLGGLLPERRRTPEGGASGPFRLITVIPAHNEEAGLPACLRSLAGAGAPSQDVVVVADNCTDGTAEAAAREGVRVLERHDSERRGKGYALDFAFSRLLQEDAGAFLIVDADTTVPPGFHAAMRRRFLDGADAAQCRYLVGNPGGSMRTRLMNLALIAFNAFRPRGRERWGLSSGILGNGFGLSRRVLEAVPYEASSVVEDLEYHLRLVQAGFRVQFAGETCVYGEMPVRGAGVRTQRARWEGGRIRMVREHAALLSGRVLRGDFRMLEPLLDLLLLPLALHVALLLAALSAPSAWIRGYAALGLLLVLVHLLGAVWRCGTGWRDLGALAVAPFYVLWKIAMIPMLIRTSRSGSAWVRTERAAQGGRK